jgi:antitoxin HigA-1
MLRSWTIIEDRKMVKKLAPVHPGEVLREEFLTPMELTPYAVARACGVPRTRIERLAREETPVTADTALRLSRYFGTTPAFWMGMQAQFDLERAEDGLAGDLKKIVPLKAA